MSGPSVLEEIKTYKLAEVAARRRERPLSEIEAIARDMDPPRGFAKALEAPKEGAPAALIAEIKKASPSKGLIRADFDPRRLAEAYAEGGASCLSVLTDGPAFQGADADLAAARAATELPALRKDFLYDPYQVAESRAIGADCILIILASVSDGQAEELEAAAGEHGLDVLLEVHDEAELARALRLRSPLLGVNNRDLHSFETRLETSERLGRDVPEDRLMVAESGIFTRADLVRMAEAGARAALVGESLMRRSDVRAAARALLFEDGA